MKEISRIVAIMATLGLSSFLLRAGTSVWEMSMPELKRHAANGEADAELALGRAYQFGKGMEKNPREALLWYEKAAAQGNGVAMRDIGRLYESGVGVAENIEEAVKWYQRAMSSRQQTFAESELLRLSKAGLTPIRYAGIPAEGILLLSILDEKTPAEARSMAGRFARLPASFADC